MHNRVGFNRLDRKPSHRKALHRNMITSLIKHERIKTTQTKAKEIRRKAEKLVTRAKVDSVHNRRIAAKTIFEKNALHKLFTEVGPRFVDRPGGYTRVLKLGRRSGDAAEMVFLEFIKTEEPPETKKKSKNISKTPSTAVVQGEDTVPNTTVDTVTADTANESEINDTGKEVLPDEVAEEDVQAKSTVEKD